MGAAASSHHDHPATEQHQSEDAGGGVSEEIRRIYGPFVVSGTLANSHGEAVGTPVEQPQGARDHNAGRGSFDYIWRVEGLTSSEGNDGDNSFRSQFKAKGLDRELSLLPEYDSRDQRSVSVRLYLTDASRGQLGDAAKVRLTYVITLLGQNSCRQHWQRSGINTFADHHDGKWGFKDFIVADDFTDPANGFVVDGSCSIGVKLLRVDLLRVKKESLLVHHRHVIHDHTWAVDNFSAMEHQSTRSQEFEAAGCRWSIYLHRIKFEHYFHDDIMLFLSLDSTPGQKTSMTVSYQFHLKGLAGGYEFCDACNKYTNVFVPGQCHGHKLRLPPDIYRESEWSFKEDTCTVRVRLLFIGYAEAKNSDGRALLLENH